MHDLSLKFSIIVGIENVSGYLYNFQTKELYNLNYVQDFNGIPHALDGTVFVLHSIVLECHDLN